MNRVEQLPRGRHSLSREEVEAAQRRRLLDAMADAVAERGYAKTSVAYVAGLARVSTETFYQRFADKQDCFLAAYEECVEEVQRVMLEAVRETEGTFEDRFRASLDAYFRLVTDRPSLAGTFLVEVYAAGPEAMKRRAEQQSGFTELATTLLGASTPRERFACRALVAATSSLLTTVVSAGAMDELPELRDQLVDLFAAALAASGRGA